MVYAAVLVDLIGDGLLIGSDSAVSSQLALLLELSQISADIPEGFFILSKYKEKGIGLRQELLVSASYVVPLAVSVMAAYF